MNTIEITIGANKVASVTVPQILVEGENRTTQIVVVTPAAWDEYTVQCLLTTPNGEPIDPVDAATPIELLNTMLDGPGTLKAEFLATRGTDVERTKNAAMMKVLAARDPLGKIAPEPLPDFIAQMVVVKDQASSAASQATQAALDIAGVPAAEAARAAFYAGFNNHLSRHDNLPPVYNGIYEPPTQPSFETTGASITSVDIYGWYDSLVSANSGVVTKSILGKDQSGTYDIFKYEFTPAVYEKIIVLSSGIHGNEVSAIISLYKFLEHVYSDREAHPQLDYLRYKAKIVVVPVINPWGMNQSTRTRYNSRSIDINRNFDYRWVNSSSAYKGASAFSEVETLLVKGVMETYPDAVGWIDFHNTLGNGSPYYLSTSQFGNQSCRFWLDAYYKIYNGTDAVRVEELPEPTIGNYAAETYGMIVGSIELMDAAFGNMYSSAGITHAVRWFGNCILDLARQSSRMNRLNKNDPFIVNTHFEASGDAVPLKVGDANGNNYANYGEIEPFRVELDIPCPGILEVEAYAVVWANQAATQQFMSLSVTQSGGTTTPETKIVTQQTRNHVYYNAGSANKRTALTTRMAERVEPTSELYGKVSVRTYFYTTATVSTDALIYRYRNVIKFTPSIARNRINVYTCNGRTAQGTNGMIVESQS